jgi:hypothetical protein
MDALQRLLKELAETLDALPTPMTPHPDGLDEATRSD